MPGVKELHAQCLNGGHANAATGMPIGDGVVAFAVPLARDDIQLVAVEGRGLRFATAIVPGEDDKFTMVVGHYLPSADEFEADMPSPLPEDDKAVIALAEQRRQYAGDFRPGLADVVKALEANGRMPYGGDCFGLKVRHVPDGRINTYIAVDQVWIGHWNPYAELMAPVVAMAAAPEFAWCMNDQDSELVEAALGLDGGFYGEQCRALDGAVREMLLVTRARASAAKFTRVHDALIEHGYVWGKKRLRFGDHDEAMFAVPTGTPGIEAYIREHGDARTLVTLERADDGTLERIEALPLYWPQARLMENWYERTPACLDNMARLVAMTSNLDATPPRLTQSDAVRILAVGGPLPPAAISIDLVAGRVALSANAAQIGKYLFFETDLAYCALSDLTPGAKNEYGCKAAKTFGDEDYEPSTSRRR